MKLKDYHHLLKLVSLIFIFMLFMINMSCSRESDSEIKVGILHSLTGTMAASEKPIIDSTLMSIKEINENGGLLGKKIVPIIFDGASNADNFAKGADKLLKDDKVSVVFGCWTSASRKAVKPVFEKNKGLLLYPVQYEGMEQSPNIIYTGAAPNQQIIPAVYWCFNKFGRKFFLIGSDYIFPRMANEIVKFQVQALGGKIVGEHYEVLGSKNFDKIAEKISRLKPDVIINTVNGSSNLQLFESLNRNLNRDIPIMSFSIAECELKEYHNQLKEQDKIDVWKKTIVGTYACWNYFQSIESPRNSEFISNYRALYGADRVTDDPLEAGYFGVKLWAKAVEEANDANPVNVLSYIGNNSYMAPEGLVIIDSENHHTWKNVRIGKIRADGQFDTVWKSDKPIEPVPFPVFKSKKEWERLIDKYYRTWNSSWTAPAADTDEEHLEGEQE